MRTYLFSVVLEADEDRWVAHCPALVEKGGATWGSTREEALENLQEVVRMTVRSMIFHGEPIPQEPASQVQVLSEAKVAVTA